MQGKHIPNLKKDLVVHGAPPRAQEAYITKKKTKYKLPNSLEISSSTSSPVFVMIEVELGLAGRNTTC